MPGEDRIAALARSFGLRASVALPVDLADLDRQLLDPVTGRIRLLPTKSLEGLGLDRVRAWACARARYQVVTQELVGWLRQAVGGRRAIEVGAGMGDLGFHLGIQMTDSHVQERNRSNQAYIALLRQVPTRPPRDVERVDANTAVRLYKPEVVVASWLTQYGTAKVPQSNSWGPREHEFLERAEYIHIGNADAHSQKQLLHLPHHVFTPPGLVSRAERQDQNLIYVWERRHAG